MFATPGLSAGSCEAPPTKANEMAMSGTLSSCDEPGLDALRAEDALDIVSLRRRGEAMTRKKARTAVRGRFIVKS